MIKRAPFLGLFFYTNISSKNKFRMGKLNEIQEQMTQSYGSNSFTTTIKETTVEFDSLKDKFTFKDEVEVPSLKVNGESVSPQVQADWNQSDDTAVDYIKNRICYEETVGREYYNQSEGYETIDMGGGAFEKYDVITLESFTGRTFTINLGGEIATFDTSDYVTMEEGIYTVGDGGLCMLLTVPNQEEGLSEGLYFMSSMGGVSVQYNLTGKNEIHTIADKYISDNIARTADIPAPQVQVDWNQSNSSKTDFVKNKPSLKSGSGQKSINEGDVDQNTASGFCSHSEGMKTKATGDLSHSEGWNTEATNVYCHAEGNSTVASGYDGAHSEGSNTTASGTSSHSEGAYNTSSGVCSHSEGNYTEASGINSHSEGFHTIASGLSSHTSGEYTNATRKSQFVFGEYNIAESGTSATKGTYVEIVGNGTNNNSRSNARTLDWSGNEMLAGTLTIGGASGATIKVESGSLKVSFDGGTTWLTISAS